MAAIITDFTDHTVQVYWLQEWAEIIVSLPQEATETAATNGDPAALAVVHARLAKFLHQTVRVSARCRTAFRKQKMGDGHEMTNLALNEFEKDIRDRAIVFTGKPTEKGVVKTHRVTLLQAFHTCRHTIEVDRVVCAPFSAVSPAPNVSPLDINLYAGMLVEAEAHRLDTNGWDFEEHRALLDPMLFHIKKVLCGGHYSESENERAYTTTMRWLSDMVRNCCNPRMCLVFCGGKESARAGSLTT